MHNIVFGNVVGYLFVQELSCLIPTRNMKNASVGSLAAVVNING